MKDFIKDTLNSFQSMSSNTILDYFGMDYELESVEGDGNCFYHAVSMQLHGFFDFKALKTLTANHLRTEDVKLFNVINESDFTLESLKHEITTTNNVWADSTEIYALSRALPNVTFIIFNDEFNVVNKIKASNEAHVDAPHHLVFLLRRNLHFTSVQVSNKMKDKLNNLVTIEHYKVSPSLETHTIIAIYFLFPLYMLLQFFNRSL